MSLHKQPVLKEAVLKLSQREKDKLLVRLISKDKMLMKQLHYQLLEDEADLEDRISSLKNKIQELLLTGSTYIKNLPSQQNYKELNSLIRQANGLINEHEKITKDKFSDVESRLMLLHGIFTQYPRLFIASHLLSNHKLRQYVLGRVKNLSTKYDKLHEDLQFDLQEPMESILDFADKHIV